jgi:hypothetical protein
MAGATILLSNLNISENPANGAVIGILSIQGAEDDEIFEYQLADSLDERFEIRLNEATGQHELVVKTGGSLFDFEDDALNDFSISITATGDKGTAVGATPFTIAVTDNAAPTDILLSNASVLEHAAQGAEVGTLSAADPDPDDSFTFTLTDDAGGRFDIVDGKLVVKDGALLDFLTAASHQVTVKVTDSDSNTFEETLTISISDAFESLKGTGKNDKIMGTEGADLIDGGAGNDKVYGRGGNDVINGGTGKDILYGGAGRDSFVFNTALKKGHFDQVMDFVSADDTIQISLSALQTLIKSARKGDDNPSKGDDHPSKKGKSDVSPFSIDKALKKGKLEKKFFTIGSDGKDSNDFIYYNKKNGFVYLDVDGSGGRKGIEILKLKPGAGVAAEDFLFI